jgi:hypothetical protein
MLVALFGWFTAHRFSAPKQSQVQGEDNVRLAWGHHVVKVSMDGVSLDMDEAEIEKIWGPPDYKPADTNSFDTIFNGHACVNFEAGREAGRAVWLAGFQLTVDNRARLQEGDPEQAVLQMLGPPDVVGWRQPVTSIPANKAFRYIDLGLTVEFKDGKIQSIYLTHQNNVTLDKS